MNANSYKILNKDIWFSMCKRLRHRGVDFGAFASGGNLNISSPSATEFKKAVDYLKKMGAIGKATKFKG